ncbi:hypothetical protein E2P30_01125 [Candidatus Bathyarchaeota archaeon]|nr:hypothetical protein E2P30_01125 [Candidatus Bathyarchaeota archaeon]
MDKKIMALSLLTMTILAAVISGLIITTQATATNSTTTDITTTTPADQNSLFMVDIGKGGCRGRGGWNKGMGVLEVSSEYTARVNAILEADTDMQNLISEGYNLTSIKPIIKSVVATDGMITTKATTAIAFLENGVSGHAVAIIDVENATVMKIVITTITVIDKTSS